MHGKIISSLNNGFRYNVYNLLTNKTANVTLTVHSHHIICILIGVSDHDLLFSRQAQDKAPSAEEGKTIIAEMEGENHSSRTVWNSDQSCAG